MRRGKWIYILLIALIVLCLVACGNDNEDDASQKTSEPDPTNVATPTANSQTSAPTNIPTPESKTKLQVGQYVKFGAYEQDNNTDNGAEEIEWIVQDVDGDKVLLVSKYILDCVPYHNDDDDEQNSVTWETCTLRKWLNGDFYNSAFSDEEKKSIQTVSLVNEDNQYYGTNGGNTTSDKVFCLSVSEIMKYNTFSTWDGERYYGYSETLVKTPTKYAQRGRLAVGTIDREYYDADLKDKGYSQSIIGIESSCWWLRSIGCYDEREALRVCLVDWNGEAGAYSTDDIWDNDIGVCPAIWISTESGSTIVALPTNTLSPTPMNTLTPMPTSSPTPTPTNSPTPESEKKLQVGQYVKFGAYEQDNNTENGAEEIEWIVQDVDGDKVLLVSKYILDCVPYHNDDDDEQNSVTWETCTLRKWLNGDFYNSAFSDEEKKSIQTVSLVNEENQYYGTNGGNTTSDKVFCLSVSEIMKYNTFSTWDAERYYGYSETLIKTPTKYAQRGRLNAETIDSEYYDADLKDKGYSQSIIGIESSCWWLRSIGFCDEREDLKVCLVDWNGEAGAYCTDDIWDNDIGVCPAIWVSTEPGF